jgi:hypothetical protein
VFYLHHLPEIRREIRIPLSSIKVSHGSVAAHALQIIYVPKRMMKYHLDAGEILLLIWLIWFIFRDIS